MSKVFKKNICVDFDGVLNNYSGWKGEDDLGEPLQNVEDFLKELSENFCIYIFTTRSKDKVLDWLVNYDLVQYVFEITNVKIPAVVYIDDRALYFDGNYETILNKVNNFKTHWELKKQKEKVE